MTGGGAALTAAGLVADLLGTMAIAPGPRGGGRLVWKIRGRV